MYNKHEAYYIDESKHFFGYFFSFTKALGWNTGHSDGVGITLPGEEQQIPQWKGLGYDSRSYWKKDQKIGNKLKIRSYCNDSSTFCLL